jgi:hypothetical protein
MVTANEIIYVLKYAVYRSNQSGKREQQIVWNNSTSSSTFAVSQTGYYPNKLCIELRLVDPDHSIINLQGNQSMSSTDWPDAVVLYLIGVMVTTVIRIFHASRDSNWYLGY